MVEFLANINITEIIVVAMGGYFTYLQSKDKKDKAAAKKIADEREEKDRLEMNVLLALVALVKCQTLNNLSHDVTVCDEQKAMEKTEKATAELDDFMQRISREHLKG